MLPSLIILSLIMLVICFVLVSIVIKLKNTLKTERVKYEELTSNYNKFVLKYRDELECVIEKNGAILDSNRRIIEGLEADVKYTENLASLYFKKYLESLRIKKGYKLITPVQDVIVECQSGKSPKEIYELYKHSEVSNIIGQGPQQKLIVCGYNKTSIILGSTDFNGMRSLPDGFIGSKVRYLSYNFLVTSSNESQNK